MKPAQRTKLKKVLLDLRKKALAAAPARIEPNRTDETQVGVLDEDAQALNEMVQVLASQRNRGHAEQVLRIDRALRFLEEKPDGFGLCQECGEEIALARLELMPFATLCTGCQQERDPKRGVSRKKITDYQ